MAMRDLSHNHNHRYNRPSPRPAYDNEDDDYDDDDRSSGFSSFSTSRMSTAKRNARTWFWVIVFICGFFFLKYFYKNPGVGNPDYYYDRGIGVRYQVTGVSNGAVHTVNLHNGKAESFYDANLVNQALSGKLKKGDVIQAQ